MITGHLTKIAMGVGRVFLAHMAVLAMVTMIETPSWASEGFKKGANLVIGQSNPQSLPQAVKVVEAKNGVFGAPGQKVGQPNVVQRGKAQNTSQKPPLKVRQWIKDVSKGPEVGLKSEKDPFRVGGRKQKKVSVSIVTVTKKAEQQLIIRALELGYQKIPDRIKEWMSYVHHIVIIDDVTHRIKGTANHSTIFIDRRSVLNLPPDGVSAEEHLLAVIAHEAKHIEQYKKGLLLAPTMGEENEYVLQIGDINWSLLQAEKEAHREEYNVMKILGFPEEELACKKWLIDNIGVGNTLVDRYVTGIDTEEERATLRHQRNTIREQVKNQKK